jgi:ketosteroid isomerase-like protein
LRRDGRATSFEIVAKYVTEHLESRVGENEDITPCALRATMIFRPEDGTWKVVHRHADPITTAQPAESVIQK